MHVRQIAVTMAVILAVTVASADDKPPRLKYRSKGPPCSCSSGLSEAEISKAMSKLDRLQDPRPDAPAGMRQLNEQQPRREADEAQK